MARKNRHKIVIGRAELLHFIDHKVVDVPAKIDTGAYRSAIHADQINLSDDGKKLSFRLFGGHPIVRKFATNLTVTDFSKVTIENSFGHREERYEVNLRIQLGLTEVETGFTLANRSKKVYPILIGRKLLNNRFVVDTSLTSVDRTKLKKQVDMEFPKDEEAGGKEDED